MVYKSVLFDLDGTLLDTLEDLADATNKSLTNLGYPPHPVAAYRQFVGEGVEKLVNKCLPEAAKNAENIAKMLEQQRLNYEENWNHKTKPYAGINAMLGELSKKHISLSILSNKPDDFTKLCVSQLLPLQAFSIVQGARSGVPKKPNPGAAIEIVGRLGILPEDVVYLGDTNTDMQTACNAGMYPVGALWGFRDEKELKETGAKLVISEPLQLLELFN